MKAKENKGMKLFLIFTALLVIYSLIGLVSALPADPGHGAASIGPGTFEGGHYIFPNNLSVTENFSVDTNTLFVDSALHRIGIGTGAPLSGLHINGTGMLLRVGNDSETFLIVNQTAGGVGIGGRTDPRAFLEVSEYPSWDTRTSGNAYSLMSFRGADPSASSSSYYYSFYGGTETKAGNTQDVTGALYSDYTYASHKGNGTLSWAIAKGGGALNPTNGTVTNAIGGNFFAENYGMGNITNAYGVRARVFNENVSNISNAYGVYSRIYNNDTGSITTASGLHVDSPSITAGAIGTNYGLYLADQSGAATNYAIYSAGGDSYFAGDVGIGTDSPGVKLDVKSGAVSTDVLRVLSSDGGSIFEISEDSGTGGFVGIKDASAVRQVLLHTSGDSYLTGGNVGIGTTSPTEALEINISEDTAYTTIAHPNVDSAMVIYNTANTETDKAVGLSFYVERDPAQTSVGGIYGVALADNSLDFAFKQENSGTVGETMRITAAGNVGIGTTSPGSHLQINETPGDHSANPTLSFGDGDSGFYESSDDDLVIGRAGAYHFGITSSGIISGAGTGPLIAQTGATSTVPTLVPNRNDVNTGIGGTSDDNLSIITGGTEAIRIDSSQNVGIGTSSPGYKLHVAGDIYNDAWYISSSVIDSYNSGGAYLRRSTSGEAQPQYTVNGDTDTGIQLPGSDVVTVSIGGTEKVRIDSSGNVGIGTTTPGNELEVDGTINATAIKVGTTDVCQQDGTNCPAGATSESPWTNDTSKIYPVNTSLNVTVDTDTLYVDVTNDRIGIGTASPSRILDIADGTPIIELQDTSALITNTGYLAGIEMKDSAGSSGGYLGFDSTGDNNFMVHSAANADMEFWTNNAQRMTIDNTGNVGIGATGPGYPLHVYKDTSTLARFERHTSADGFIDLSLDGTDPQIILDPGTGTTWTVGNDDGDSDKFKILTGQSVSSGTARLTIDISGQVGIGTITPQNKLNVIGDINATTNITTPKLCLDGDCQTEWPSGGGGWTVSGTYVYNDTGGVTVGIGTSTPARALTVQNAVPVRLTDGTYGFDLAIGTNILSIRNSGTDDEIITFKRDDGHVGIGTTGPGTELHLNGTTPFFTIESDADNTDMGIYLKENGGQNMGTFWYDGSESLLKIETYAASRDIYLDPGDGGVGIHDTDPGTKLSINATTDQLGIIDSDGSQEWRISANSNLFYIEDENSGAIPFKIEDGADTDTLFVDDSGQVGIGTTTPGATLGVHGSGTGGLSLNVTNDLFVNDTSGYVGVGTANPAHKLHVEGSDDIYMRSRSTSADSTAGVSIYNDAQEWIWRVTGSDGDKFQLRDVNNNAQRITVDTSGNVGIGTASPSHPLDVNGTIRSTNASNIGTLSLGLSQTLIGNGYGGATSTLGIRNWDGSDYFDAMAVTGSTHYVLLAPSEGNVGINTTTPQNTLHVVGSGRFDGPIYIRDSSGNARGYVYGHASANTVGFGTDKDRMLLSNSGLQIYTPVTPYSKYISIGHDDSDGFISTSSGDIVLSPNSGYVGIGDSSPARQLDILSTSADAGITITSQVADGDPYINFEVDSDEWAIGVDDAESDSFQIAHGNTLASGEVLTMLTGGNVGIGNTAPSNILTVGSTSNTDHVKIILNDTYASNGEFLEMEGYWPKILFDDTAGGGADFEIWNLGAELRFGTSTGSAPNAAFYIKSGNAADTIFNGKVGIGISSPDYPLHVNNTIRINTNDASNTGILDFGNADAKVGFESGNFNIRRYDGVDYYESIRVDGTNHYTILSPTEGSVGIGTTSPSSALEVNGNVELTNLYDNDASNFFDGGCSADQYISGIDSTGAITCAADSGTGTMSSWTLAGTSGTPQSITNGNTATIAAGSAITTTAGATDTVTVGVTNDAITDTQLAYNTGQHLTTSSTPQFARAGLGGAAHGVAGLYVQTGEDVELATSGYIVTGSLTSTNIGIDDNEIAARNNGATATLYLNNNGGPVSVGSGGLSVSGALSGTTLNTGQGAQELYGMAKDLVAGTGIGGGGDDVLYGPDGDVTLTVAGGTCLTADADGLSVTGNCIGNTQLEFDTGQALTTTSNPTFGTLTLTTLKTTNLQDSDASNFFDNSCTYGIQSIDSTGAATCAAQQGTGSGTVNTGAANKLAYYPSAGTTVDDLTGANNGAIYYSAAGAVQSGTLPVLSGGTGVTTSTGTGSVVLSASPTFTGTVGAAAITASGTVTASSFSGAGTGLTGTAASLTAGTASTALTGDSATAFFSTGTLEDDRLSFTLADAVADGGCTNCITDGMVSDTLTASYATNADTVDSLHAADFLRSNADDSLTAAIVVPTANRDEGIFGTYDSAKTQHVWSMGTGYRNAADGSSFGNLYGLAYKYNGDAGGHGVYLVQNGVAYVGLGTNLWTSGAITGATINTGYGAKEIGDTVGNCASTDVHKGDGGCEAESGLSVSYATTAGGAPPTGTASGDLSGSYPSPQVLDDSHNHIYSNIDATTSANWATRVSDEQGSGYWVFNGGPSFTGETSVTATSTSWGVAPSAGWKTTMGTSTGATWLAYGESSNTFRGGLQLLDSGGSMRIYVNTGYVSISSGGSLTVPGDVAVNGDDITCDGDLTITPSGGDMIIKLG